MAKGSKKESSNRVPSHEEMENYFNYWIPDFAESTIDMINSLMKKSTVAANLEDDDEEDVAPRGKAGKPGKGKKRDEEDEEETFSEEDFLVEEDDEAEDDEAEEEKPARGKGKGKDKAAKPGKGKKAEPEEEEEAESEGDGESIDLEKLLKNKDVKKLIKETLPAWEEMTAKAAKEWGPEFGVTFTAKKPPELHAQGAAIEALDTHLREQEVADLEATAAEYEIEVNLKRAKSDKAKLDILIKALLGYYIEQELV